MRSRLLVSESHHSLEVGSEVDSSIITQSRSTPTILPSLPGASDNYNVDDKSDVTGKKETASHFVERIRANSTTGQQGINESLTPTDGSPMKVEFRKSRSLVKKIQERTATKEAALRLEPPKELESSSDVNPTSAKLGAARVDIIQGSNRSVAVPELAPTSSPLVASAPKSLSKLHASPHSKPIKQRQIPGLTLERVQSSPSPQAPFNQNLAVLSDAPGSDSAAAVQQFSFPKPLNANSSTPISASSSSSTQINTASISTSATISSLPVHNKNNIISSMPTEYRSRTKLPDHFPGGFVVVENTQAAPKGDDRAVENDRILQQRLQQAKALDRKSDNNGAVMFKFALWGKKNTTDEASKVAEMAAAQPKSASKLRGPKIAREIQQFDDNHITNGEIQESVQASHIKAPRTPQRVLRSQSVPTTPATVTLLQQTPHVPPNTINQSRHSESTQQQEDKDDDRDDSYSDGEFERVIEEEQSLVRPQEHQDTHATGTNQPNSSQTTTLSSSAQPVRNLAMALRTLVVEAKSLGSEYSSPAQSGSDPQRNQYLSPEPSMSNNEVTEDVENSYSSFAAAPNELTKAVIKKTEDGIPVVDDDLDSNSDWDDNNEIETDEANSNSRKIVEKNYHGVRRSFSAEHLDGYDTPQSIQTVMSKSGPAAFLSSMNSIQGSDSFVKQYQQQSQPLSHQTNQSSIQKTEEIIYDDGQQQDNSSGVSSASSSFMRNRRANSCGVSEFRQSMQGIAYNKDGSIESSSENSTITSLTSRDEKKEAVTQPVLTAQSQTPESYRYSSRPEASNHSRYQAMRQTRESMKRNQFPKDDKFIKATVEPSITEPADQNISPDHIKNDYTDTVETGSGGTSLGLDREYHSSPDNNSISLGNSDVLDFATIKSDIAPPLSHSDHTVDATPRLTEMSDSEDDILGIPKATIPPMPVVSTHVAVTPLNPTGNPFHRFAEPIRHPNTQGQKKVAAANSLVPPLSSQPQPVIPISEFLATISASNNKPSSTPDKTNNEATKSTTTPMKLQVDTATTLLANVTPGPKERALPANMDPNDGQDHDLLQMTERLASPLKWIKGDVIGEGTFGKVYKGLNQSTGELLAIKQFYLADGSEEEVDDLQREIAVMWELDHENIVRYLGTSKTDRFLYIILEYVTGGSIASMLAQYGPFTESLIRRFSYHILSGMQYLHSQGIIHRDIKGANILVTDAGIAKLADFGCSKRLAGLCTTSLEESMNIMRGSVPWMAPEVIKQAGYGRSSDIWSFGATIIEMATGKPPWSEYTNNLATLFHVATSNKPPATPAHLSSSCQQFLEICMIVEPDGRATAKQLLQDSSFMQEEMERANEQVRRRLQQQQTMVVPAKPLYTTPIRRDRVQRPGSAAHSHIDDASATPVSMSIAAAAAVTTDTPRRSLAGSFSAAATADSGAAVVDETS